jgi:hypothetical protein
MAYYIWMSLTKNKLPIQLTMKSAIINKLLQDNIGQNETCKNCKEQNGMITKPLTPYMISDSATLPDDRIMFIGKAARGDGIGEEINDYLEDVTSFGKKFLSESSWAFYSYTKEIVEKYYGNFDEALKHISISNMMKCNNETMTDTTPWEAKINCIEKNRFIWNEMEILMPKRIIFYTHSYYDKFINDYKPANCSSVKDITDINYRITIGEKTSLYWHREFRDVKNNVICSFIRVSHPMKKKRQEFVDSILNWLKQTENK